MFIERLLYRTLVDAIDRDGARSANLCLGGGCALNIKWNRRIRASGMNLWVPPFPNDSGAAIGAACAELFYSGGPASIRWNVYSGPAVTAGVLPAEWRPESCTVESVARRLANTGRPIVFLSGAAELGPRALGHRSILAPATSVRMRDDLNRIKNREPYRPVAPMCLEENASDIFDPGSADPFMLFDHAVRDSWRARIPAVVHADGTARLQTVGANDDPTVFRLLTEYRRLTGIPVLCNTSANFHGSGFFPDVASAARWAGIAAIWSDGTLYTQQA
jgi:carbamoyltransferase